MIVLELIKIQKQTGLNDKEFADTLGIHVISWKRNKRTKVIGADVLLRAMSVYPEFREKFLESFRELPQKLSFQRERGLLARLKGFIKGVIRLCLLVKIIK